MRFIIYPDAVARKAQTGGTVTQGDYLSEAPPSGSWAYVRETRKYYRVFGARHKAPDGAWLQSAIEADARPAGEK